MIKRLPWLRSLKKTDPEPPVRLPIACGPVSNGEGWWPDSARKRLIRKLVLDKAEEVSRRHGVDRREFLASACGMATSLYMINLVNGCSSGKDGPQDGRLGMSGNGGSAGSGGNGGRAGSGGGDDPDAGMGMGGSGGGSGSGGYLVNEEMIEDPDCAAMALGMGGNELIIDMQSHFASVETNPIGSAGLSQFVGQINNERYPWIVRSDGVTGTGRFDRTEYVNQIFMGSDTTIGVLSGIAYSLGDNGMNVRGFAALSNEDLITGANWLEERFPGRMLSHAMVMPNDRLDVQLAMMERLSSQYTNWKTYPPWTPTGAGGVGYWLDSPEAQAMFEKGIELGSPIFCIHKGFPLNSFSPTYTDPKDVGPAANMFPNAALVIYHSGFEHGLASGQSTAPDPNDPMADNGWGEGTGPWPEGPYDESLEEMGDNQPTEVGSYPLNRGVNSLIWSLRKAGIGPNGTRLPGMPGPKTHVYAECGGVWPNLLHGRVEEAMHYWGKLLKYIGEDRIVWGTDCLWFGSPQPVIQAFRAFEISQAFQDRYGYPALTQARKEKILGQNAARLQNVRLSHLGGMPIEGCHSDYISAAQIKMKKEYDEEFGPRRDMMFAVAGPRTRREFLNLRAHEHQEKMALSGRIPNRRRI
jgi:uncharacterized protein